jgi:membrane protein required for colicin V production
MNIIDLLILVVILAGATLGAVKGISRILLAALGLVCGIVTAARLHLTAARLMESLVENDPLRRSLGFALVFLLTWLIFLLLGQLISGLLRRTGLKWLDRTVGGAVGLGAAALFLFFILILLTALLPVNSPLLTGSRLSPHLLGVMNRASTLVSPEARHRFSDKLEAVRLFWDQSASR